MTTPTPHTSTPRITDLRAIPVAGRDSMLMNSSGAHGPCFTRNLVVLTDSAGNAGVGEVPGGLSAAWPGRARRRDRDAVPDPRLDVRQQAAVHGALMSMRRHLMAARASVIAAAAFAVVPIANAQSASAWPTRTVTVVVPFPPGGGTDTGARIVAEQLGKRWGQTVIVENKGGAAGQIGADLVAKAKPDGYTILMGNLGTQAINPSLYAKMPYDPDKAFAPIALVAELPLAMMVNPSVPAKTAAEFVALAKAQPGKLSYSSSGSVAGRTLRPRCSKTARRPSSFTCRIAAAALRSRT
jgi:Tripartite tricarboxylate transporter family receptor